VSFFFDYFEEPSKTNPVQGWVEILPKNDISSLIYKYSNVQDLQAQYK